jgi:hypothetical protein
MVMQRSNLLTVAGILMVIASIISLVLGILLLDSYFSYKSSKYIPYEFLTVGSLNLTAFPLGLISGVLLLSRKYANVGAIVTIAVLVIALAIPLIRINRGYIWEPGLLVGLPIIVFSAIALALALLGQRKYNQVTD